MCYGCWEEYGRQEIVNERTIKAANLADEVYKHNCVGGNLHIVLDDWNIEDENIDWCINHIKTQPNDDSTPEQLKAEMKCAEYLRGLTIEERNSAMAIQWKFIEKDTP